MSISNPRNICPFEIRQVDEGFVIYDSEREQVHQLNPAAGLVLLLCTGANSIRAIAEHLGRHFELSEPPLADVENVLGQLVDQGLVTFPDEHR